MKIILTLILAMHSTFLFASSTGSITGEVIDGDTHQPLIGANVILIGTELGCASNTDGKCSVANIPVGSYTISISMIGYESVSRSITLAPISGWWVSASITNPVILPMLDADKNTS